MAEKVILAVDACGGDRAPDVVLEGVAQALAADPDLEVILCGLPFVVEGFAAEHERCHAQPTSQVIEMGEHPAEAVKEKADSSIVVGCKLVREGRAQGFFSAGSTGACLVSATLNIGRIKGVKRPALGIILPGVQKETLLLDVGANADVKLDYILQFAQMGCAYMTSAMGVENPKAGLLNIGEEEAKGSLFAQDAFHLLRDRLPQFAGNCEGGDLLNGDFDVVVTDGFTGNVALKTIEGTSKMLFKLLKGAFMSSAMSKLGAVLLKGSLMELKRKVSPDTYGGSPLLGINGVCMVGHGSSNATAVRNGILSGCREVRAHVGDAIAAVVDRKRQGDA